MSSRRVLHVLGTAELAGTAICRIVESLAAAIDPTRYQIEVCFLRDGELSDRLQQVGIKSKCVNWNGSARDLRGAARYAALMRSSEFNIIHQHTGGRALTELGRLLSNARIVRHLHGRASEQTGIVPARPRHVPKSDALIAVSRIVAEFSQDPRVVVIYPGIDVSLFPDLRKPNTRRVIGTACRLEPIKGIRYLIEALALITPEVSDLRLEIAGDGALRSSLEQECRRLGIADHVTFLGWREDLRSLMADWDIFVLPSLDEGFPIAALEAMASGLPVVASAVGGLCEMLIDGDTGFLASAAVPAELASRIRELIDDSQLRERMGVAGRQRVFNHFSAAQMTERTIRVYDELFSG